jgi:hypothetical protein
MGIPVICVTRLLNPGRGQRVPDRSCHLMASPDSHVTQPQTKPRVSTQAIDVSVQSRPNADSLPCSRLPTARILLRPTEEYGRIKYGGLPVNCRPAEHRFRCWALSRTRGLPDRLRRP